MRRFRFVIATFAMSLTAAIASGQTSSLTGRVADSQGGTITGADITLVPPPSPPMPGMRMPAPASPQFTARSRADGTFALDQVPAGRYVLQVDAPGFGRSSQEITLPNAQALGVTLEPLEIPGAETAAAPAGAPAAAVDTQALLDRIKVLEQRLSDLESGTVLSEPETRVKRIEVYVDKNGNEHDQPIEGAKKEVTYQRERVYRRQWLSEKLEQAFGDFENNRVKLGLNAASVTQFTNQTSGAAPDERRHRTYQLSSADLFFSAGLAQYTSVFADVVGLSGAPPDAEIHNLTLFNSYSARLVRNNEVNVREAWLRTEFFSQKLGLIAGRVDMTNYFDRNVVANDETSQFISDALVNNPALVLPVNGSGVVGIFDPKNGLTFKAGFQQSNNEATNLSDSIYSLTEVAYVARPPGLSEGNYRVWYRNDNSTGPHRHAIGLSADQKLTPTLTLFGRYGSGKVDAPTSEGATRLSTGSRFYSGGFQFRNGVVFNPLDVWGIGYARTSFPSGPGETLLEGYYNFKISEKLRLSFNLQHVLESPPGTRSLGFLVPAVRLQATF